ncbi:AraC family transcriptional regulator [Actinotalea sp. M2MS4P-6]|uniref:AraC family transcriptional regulator n=1 Tax=Actinotalea sp. M2MS4P-6 TaxID=2983762 RepID=UPI0021E4C29E|nr:AraC family transcriptional regulator [Actinotalea sp. M2MS4P-6]MCV2394590.1 AraC family transcriptional regulator [Actinotalea sp. M2MS4P-6]
MVERAGSKALLDALDPALRALFDQLGGTMFCAKDLQGRYVAVNQAFVDRTGRSSVRDVVGRRAEDLFVAHLAEHYNAQDEAVIASGHPLRRELELIWRPGGVAGWYLTSKEVVVVDGEVIGLVSVSEDLRRRDAADAVMTSLERVAALLSTRPPGPVPVAELAAVAGCSASTLERRMRAVYGLSPQQHVLRTRVDRAAALLSTSDLPLAEVAVRSGFYDQAVLTRTFGRLTGETPAQFRRRARGGGLPVR